MSKKSVGSVARVEDIEISCALASGATQQRAKELSHFSVAAATMGLRMRADVAAEARGERRRQG